MIASLTGKVIHRFENYIILDVGGVGYKVYCQPSEAGSEHITLFTHHHIREDQQALYGFTSHDQLELFELLLTVNGVGPKAALSIMSSASADKIISSIAQGDASLFKTVSGIGQKVAAKIIVELKNKVGGIGELDLLGLETSNEVIDALEVLGYKKAEVAEVLRNMPADIVDTRSKVSWALKEIGKTK